MKKPTAYQKRLSNLRDVVEAQQVEIANMTAKLVDTNEVEQLIIGAVGCFDAPSVKRLIEDATKNVEAEVAQKPTPTMSYGYAAMAALVRIAEHGKREGDRFRAALVILHTQGFLPSQVKEI